jgi:TolB-like protein/cytochrome c-type biogenesis protein CcmH/NrfG
MKRCPECRRDYFDDSLLYCLEDGTALVQGSVRSPDEPATAVLHNISVSAEDATKRLVQDPGPGEVGQRRRTMPRTTFAFIGACVLALGSAFFGYRYLNVEAKQITSIAVLPFENRSGSADADYLSDGLTDSLIYRFSQLPKLKVSPTSSVMRYKGSTKDISDIARDLDMDGVLSGRVTQVGDNLSISVQLIDARTKKLIWAEQYDRKMADLLATQREIAMSITQKLEPKLSGSDAKGVTKEYTNNNEAYQLYLKGRYHLNRASEEEYKKSIDYFQQAISRDPNYAQAYAGIADVYIVGTDWYLPNSEAMPKAKAAATRALEIDDSLAEGHVSMGTVRVFYDWDWPETEKEYRRAIELDPNNADAHAWYSFYLGVVQGQHADSVREARLAQQLDPLSLNTNGALADALSYAGQYDEAIEQCAKTLDLDQNFWWPHDRLGEIYERRGQYSESIAEFQKARQLDNNPLILAKLAGAYAISGKSAEAKKLINELKQLSGHRYVSAILMAQIYAALGDREQTFAWLEKGYQERSIGILFLKVDPLWDRYRSDAHFQDLVRRFGLS